MIFIGKLIIPFTILIVLIVITAMTVNISDHNRLVEHMKKTTGCEYLGHPKGVPGVGIFDCNGDIVNKRMKW